MCRGPRVVDPRDEDLSIRDVDPALAAICPGQGIDEVTNLPSVHGEVKHRQVDGGEGKGRARQRAVVEVFDADGCAEGVGGTDRVESRRVER